MTRRSGSLVPTASLTTGPFFPAQFIRASDCDLTHLDGRAAQGQIVALSGTVTDLDGVPAVNAILELWQADANGRFHHPADQGTAQPDPNFRGWGRTWTDIAGCYRFLTIKPGSTPSAGRRNTPRPPYINVMVLGSGIMRPLVTQLFFPGEKLNEDDPQLALVEPERRHLMIARPWQDQDAPPGALTLRFDIRLGGADETPFFED